MDQRWEWHQSVHERIGETLHYYFLGFSPTYDRGLVFSALRELLETKGTGGYAFYEVLGTFDIILRVWLPTNAAPHFDQTLKQVLTSAGARALTVEPFEARSVLYHWAWPGNNSSRKTSHKSVPSIDNEMRNRLSVAKLDELQKTRDRKAARVYEQGGLLKISPQREGIRFFVTIPPPHDTLPQGLVDALIRDISHILATRRKVHEAVLYRGLGQRVLMLIEGLVDFSQYREIAELNSSINAKGIERFDIKTTTFLAASIKGSSLENNDVFALLPASKVAELQSVIHYIDSEESDKFEHKGSLEFDVGRFLTRGEKAKNPKLVDEVIGTVVAMLNSHGGELLIGTIENDRFSGSAELEKYPKVGAMRIVGVDIEYGAQKWDGFSNKLLNLFTSRIGARETQRGITLRKLEYEGHDLCLIQVSRLGSGVWAYLDKEHFYVRVGSSTRLLKGRDQQEFQNDA
jgi:hypothetical protein